MNLNKIELSVVLRPTIKTLLMSEGIHIKTLRARIKRVLSDPRLTHLVPHHVELCLTLLDDNEIHGLNLEYRGKDKPTDVLSFSMLEGEAFTLPGEIATPLGDLMMSVETALKQSKRGALPRIRPLLKDEKWGLSEELSFLALHGLLHLLGFDHEVDQEAEEMEALEAALLSVILPKRVKQR